LTTHLDAAMRAAQQECGSAQVQVSGLQAEGSLS
jgi:hypothetical protein